MLQALLDALTEVLAKTSEKVSVKASEKTSEKILGLIGENPLITIAELARSIGVTERSIERNLKKLQQEQRLSRNGPAKSEIGTSNSQLEFLERVSSRKHSD